MSTFIVAARIRRKRDDSHRPSGDPGEDKPRPYNLEINMRTLEQTTDEILTLAATHFKVSREELAPEDDFFKKLGIDSLQALELLTRLENHFNVELPDYEIQGVTDFHTLADRIQSRL